MFLASVLLVSPVVLAGNFIAFQGNVKESGSNLNDGNLSVVIFDSQTGGSVIYNSTTDFDNAISAGEYDVMLGNGSNVLDLNYGTKYYLEMFVNGEAFTFDGNTRQVFESAVGNITYVNLESNIPTSYINKSAGTNWVGINLESILDTIYSWITGVNTTVNIQSLGFYNTSQIDAMTDGINTTENIGGLGFYNTSQVDGLTNTSWNETHADTLYLNIGGDTNATTACDDTEVLLGNGSCYNSSLFGNAAGDITAVNTAGEYLTGGASTGSVSLLVNETKLNESMDSRGATNEWGSTYNATYATGSAGDNASWNESYADTLYAGLNTGNNINGTQHFNGGWTQGGASISGGKLFAQTVYVYNLSSLSVSTLNINGSLIPAAGFDNQFDLGSAVLRWRDLLIGRNVNISGNLTLGAGTISWNSSGKSYIYYNGTGWQTLGTSSGAAGIWTNDSGIATYNNSVKVNGGLNVSSGSDVCIEGGNCLSTVSGGAGAGWYNTTTTASTSLDVDIQNASGSSKFFVNSTSGNVNLTGDICIEGGNCLSDNGGIWDNNSAVATYVGSANVTGNLSLGAGQIWYNESDDKYYYHNQTEWKELGSGASSSGADGIWDNESGVAAYNGSATVRGDLDIQNASGDSKVFVNTTTGQVNVTGNVTIGKALTFALGQSIQNIASGWLKVVGSLQVTGDLQVDGIFKLKESDSVPEADVGYGKIYAVNGTGGLDDYTVLLLHMDGSGQTFVDSSNSSHSIFTLGSATQTVDQRKFNVGKGGYISNTAQIYWNTTAGSDFLFNGDFTIDYWFYRESISNGNDGSSVVFSGDGITYLTMNTNNGNIHFYLNTGSYTTISSVYSADSWNHIALVRSGVGENNTKIYINGNEVYSVTNNSVLGYSNPVIARCGGGAAGYESYIDEVRVTKGLARWTENFTVESNPYDAAGLYFKDDAGRVTSLLAGGVASASAVWGQNGTNTTYQGGYVGIGTGLPLEPLHVIGNAKVEGNVTASGGDFIIELLSLPIIKGRYFE